MVYERINKQYNEIKTAAIKLKKTLPLTTVNDKTKSTID